MKKYLYILVFSLFFNSLYSQCEDGEFQCHGGTCIPSQWACDGWPDCEDGSDEIDCAGECSEFECDDGSCIPNVLECNGYFDCNDGSDEIDCVTQCEDQGLWDCGDGQCIPTSYVCDGSTEFCNAVWGPDCTNGGDEGLDVCDDVDWYVDECGGGSYYCGDDFSCYSNPSQCVPYSHVCDEWDDCTDGSDEFNCSECVIVGNINGDDSIDILDVVSLVHFILNENNITDCADINDDGDMNILDIVQLVNIILN